MIFNWIDYIIIGIIAFSVLTSLMRGFVRESLSLATWIVAFWISFTFSHMLSPYLASYVKSESIQYAAAFGLLFVATLILGSLCNFLVGQLVDMTGLSGTDRMLGSLFGVVRGVLLVSVLLMVAQLTPVANQSLWSSAVLIPYFQPVETWLQDMLPKSVSSRFVSAPTS